MSILLALLPLLTGCAHLPTVPPGARLVVAESPPAKDAPPPMLCVEPIPAPSSGDALAGVAALAQSQSFDACLALISGRITQDEYTREIQQTRALIAEVARLQAGSQDALIGNYTTFVQREIDCRAQATARNAAPEEFALCDRWQEAATAMLLVMQGPRDAPPPVMDAPNDAPEAPGANTAQPPHPPKGGAGKGGAGKGGAGGGGGKKRPPQ